MPPRKDSSTASHCGISIPTFVPPPFIAGPLIGATDKVPTSPPLRPPQRSLPPLHRRGRTCAPIIRSAIISMWDAVVLEHVRGDFGFKESLQVPERAEWAEKQTSFLSGASKTCGGYFDVFAQHDGGWAGQNSNACRLLFVEISFEGWHLLIKEVT
ncbi:hypothetical protein M427DRAFT_157939 [Gonapodya prolifera JEL478]|uniref:Uncharacterized protein n=1 Tax=Gonapodya prolifera (strain JEL478) TaxID=1344416 RepID=A0A139A4H2_GONPJ|nr:hypothetical protein M427DRAFT_157939 [Gonapodya prolifera JEL478]|eukprot:KXS11716.1 hypothetical protein M427DRAFT_157939 [Gonapodya prolifera JEL478]